MWSPNHDYWLDFDEDGNLFLYQHDHEHDCRDDVDHKELHEDDTLVWNTTIRRKSTPPYNLEMKMSNNLVVYDSKRKLVWHSKTYNKGAKGGKAILQDDGLVIYDKDGEEIWRKSTHDDHNHGDHEDHDHEGHDHGDHDHGDHDHEDHTDHDDNHCHDHDDDGNLHLELSAKGDCCIQSGQALWSPNHDYWLDFKEDGNLFLYQHDHVHDCRDNVDHKELHEDDTLVWNTTTRRKGTPPYNLEMKMNNNLVVYDSKRKAMWVKRGKGARGGKAVLQDDGFVIYDKYGVEIWRRS